MSGNIWDKVTPDMTIEEIEKLFADAGVVPVKPGEIDPKQAYEEMINSIKLEVAKILMCVKKREGYERRSTVKVTGEGREDIDGMINPELAQEEKKKIKRSECPYGGIDCAWCGEDCE